MLADASLAKLGKRRAYPLHQCAFYKLASKARLASMLGCTTADLIAHAADEHGYNVFMKAEEICPFTGKKRKEREVQEPKEQLKKLQRKIQTLISRVAPPSYSHGGLAGRSYRSNAKAHSTGSRAATFDIKSFFPSTTASRVFAFFKDQLCCEPDLAKLLTNLCCYKGILPTGAPTSPILSLYANKGLFDELAAVAEKYELQFTAYIDDVTFSGNTIPRGIAAIVKAAVGRNGHRVASQKSKIFGKNQAKHITGVVIHDGVVKVPFSRFRKARAIERAIAAADSTEKRLDLTNKLVGLVGEAAFLDARFKPKAQAVYSTAVTLKAKLAAESGESLDGHKR